LAIAEVPARKESGLWGSGSRLADLSEIPTPDIGEFDNAPRTAVDAIPDEVENLVSPILAVMSNVSIVIPVRNEAANLKHVLPRLPPGLGEVVIVVADGDERSVAAARAYVPSAKIIRDPGVGKGYALRLGVQVTSKPYVVLLDADGSMNPQEITNFLPLLQDDADLVKGSRNLPGGGSTDLTPVRVLGNRFFATAVNLLFGTKYTDLCYGYIAAKRAVFENLNLESNGFNVEAEILIKAKVHNFEVREVPSTEEARVYGESHLHWFRDGIQILATILSLFARHRLKGAR